MRAFRDGKRPATVMHQIAKGLQRRADRPAGELVCVAEALEETAMTEFKRRDFLKLAAAGATLSAAGCATMHRKAVWSCIGGGFGGATRREIHSHVGPGNRGGARRARGSLRLVPDFEPVLAGYSTMQEITTGLTTACADTACRWSETSDRDRPGETTVKLARRRDLTYDRLVMSPGIDFTFGDVAATSCDGPSGRVLHAWKAGPQTVDLRKQLEQMKDGGVYILRFRLRRTVARRTLRAREHGGRPTSSRRSRARKCWCSTPTRT
jgi:hypothetical protein